MPAVPHRLHDPAAAVIKRCGDRAGEIYSQIQRRTRQDLLRGAHQAQDIIREHCPYDREHYPGSQRKSDVRMNGGGHLFPVSGSEVSGNRNPGSYKNALHQSNQHKNQGSYGADCGKRIVAQHIPDDKRIHRAVQLLEEVAYQQRKRKAYNLACDGAFRHADG